MLENPSWTGAEGERLRALRAFDPEALTDDPELQAITDFAARLCDTPTALVSLVEQDDQNFLARTGLDARSTPRSQSFCAHAMLRTRAMVVTDATRDPRFADNPLVTGPPHIRFYAGAPLVAEDGSPLGALCVISPEVRADGLTDFQLDGLIVLAKAVMRRLAARRDEIERERARESQAMSEQRFAVLADAMPQMVWSTRPDGYHDYYNARWYEYTGMPEGSTDGEEWNGMFHPEDQERAMARWKHSLATGEPYEIEYRLRDRDGDYRWTLGRALPMRGEDGNIVRWFGTCTDIHDRKRDQENLDLVSKELVHRIKNIFSVVGGIASLSGRENPHARPAFTDFSNRIAALARAYDFTKPTGVAAGCLTQMLENLFEPYRAEGEPRIRTSGDDVEVSSVAATALSLLFHELATNAMKYGALSLGDGYVDVVIHRRGDTVVIDWIEAGGPEVKDSPRSEGFGTTLVEATVVRQLKGEFERDWTPSGLRARVSVPTLSLS